MSQPSEEQPFVIQGKVGQSLRALSATLLAVAGLLCRALQDRRDIFPYPLYMHLMSDAVTSSCFHQNLGNDAQRYRLLLVFFGLRSS